MPRKLTVSPAAAEALADELINTNSSFPYSIRFPAVILCRLKEAAKNRGIPVPQFIRNAVEAALTADPSVKKELRLAEIHERAHAVAALVRGQYIENLKIDGEHSSSSISYTSNASTDDRIIVGLAGIVAEFQVTGRAFEDLYAALTDGGRRPILSDADAAAVAGWGRLHLEAAWDLVARWLPIIAEGLQPALDELTGSKFEWQEPRAGLSEKAARDWKRRQREGITRPGEIESGAIVGVWRC